MMRLLDFLDADLILDPAHVNYGPTYITVTERPAIKAFDEVKSRKPKHKKPVPPTTKTLTEKEGVITHKVIDDGDINICIRAASASHINPLRFGLRVEEGGQDEKKEEDPGKGVGYHLSFMENEMIRIERSMHTILREADFAKERDAVFHQQTDAMNSATVFWPIMQVCILLATGFTQANHIVRFFKQRRIV
jgi:hypothetical protein